MNCTLTHKINDIDASGNARKCYRSAKYGLNTRNHRVARHINRGDIMVFSNLRRSVLATASVVLGVLFLPQIAAAETPAKISPASGAENADFDVYFPLRNETAVHALIDAQIRPGSPQYHRWLTPQQFQRRFGPTEATIARVTAELAARGLRVTQHNGQQLHVAGTAAAVRSAFHVNLWHSRFSDGSEALVADRGLTLT